MENKRNERIDRLHIPVHTPDTHFTGIHGFRVPVGKLNDQGTLIIHIQRLAVANLITTDKRNLPSNGDAVLAILCQEGGFFCQKSAAHGKQGIQFCRSYPATVHILTGDHGKRTGNIPNLSGEVLPPLAAVNADTSDGIVNEPLRIQSQFCQDTAQLSFPIYDIICPLDSGTESGTFLNGITNGNTGGAGKVHQMGRGTRRTQQNAKI